MLPILKDNIVRTSEPRHKMITTHFSCYFVIARHPVEIRLVFQQKVGYGRVMARVLAVELGTVRKITL